jgi:hypothetical protein
MNRPSSHCKRRERRLGTAWVLQLILFAAGSVHAQTVRVDIDPAHLTAFDPDQALGTSLDILPAAQFDRIFSDQVIQQSLSAGWGPITYRQNTELTIAAWHWNPNGAWSDAAHESGYFTGSREPGQPISKSFGYRLPHRGMTRTDASERQFSRLTDGDTATYWKSNPYLARKFTGEEDSLHPQWILIDFDTAQDISAVQIAWAQPYARKYLVQYWTGEDALLKPTAGAWSLFPRGDVQDGHGGTARLHLSDTPIHTRFVRIVMTESSNSCDTHGPADLRNCVGYAVGELYVGNLNGAGEFVDLVSHAPGQNQTATYVSSTDPWHSAADMEASRIQSGFDLFFTSGYTNKLPAMIPISMIYSTPEDAAAEIAYVRKRGYPVSYIEMGEEPDGKNFSPEDYGTLYLQFASALHQIDPGLKLGGPIFEGRNEDLEVWPDSRGRTSWLGRFIDYLKQRKRLGDLSFVSFEHYPFPPCEISWSDLYREPALVRHILETWRQDGVPAEVPLMNTESNISWALTEAMSNTFAALWLADSVGAFLTFGGPGTVYYHSPIQPEPLRPGCHGYSTYGNFVADHNLKIRGYTSQYFASRLINLEWVAHRGGRHQLAPAESDVRDDAGHALVTAYAARRPDGEWSLLLINKDPSNAHRVKIEFASADSAAPRHFAGPLTQISFGAEQYLWHPDGPESHPDPDGPPTRQTGTAADAIVLPRASVSVVRGKLN